MSVRAEIHEIFEPQAHFAQPREIDRRESERAIIHHTAVPCHQVSNWSCTSDAGEVNQAQVNLHQPNGHGGGAG